MLSLYLQARLHNLTRAAHIVGSHEAQGPAKQILPDSNFLSVQPLRQAFVDCSQRARTRNAHRKANSLRALVTTSGRRVGFTREGREAISLAVLQMIRCART